MSGRLHGDPAAIALLARSMHRFVDERAQCAREFQQTLASIGPAWCDDSYDQFLEDFSGELVHLEGLLFTWASLAQRLDQLALRYTDLGHGPSAAARGTAPPRASSPTKPMAQRAEPELLVGMERNRQVLSARLLDAMDRRGAIDWGDQDFHASFDNDGHHGYFAEDYTNLARGLTAARRGDDGTRAAAARSAYIDGSDPIHVERREDGSLNVIDGRHRLLAAIREGVDVPVELVLARAKTSPST